jgi:hypothetical protein
MDCYDSTLPYKTGGLEDFPHERRWLLGSDLTDGLRESLSINYEQGAAKLDMAEALLPI